jgi:hypothetical protein
MARPGPGADYVATVLQGPHLALPLCLEEPEISGPIPICRNPGCSSFEVLKNRAS